MTVMLKPFRTGLSAFSLGLGKLVVPMVFVYAPTMLIMLPEYFTLASFVQVSVTCALGIVGVASAITGYLLTPIGGVMRIIMAIVGIMWIAPGLTSDIAALVMSIPVVAWQVIAMRKTQMAA